LPLTPPSWGIVNPVARVAQLFSRGMPLLLPELGTCIASDCASCWRPPDRRSRHRICTAIRRPIVLSTVRDLEAARVGVDGGGICEALGGRYPVDREVLAADVRGLVEALAGAGLVEAAWTDRAERR
jgi:hypothetical protein